MIAHDQQQSKKKSKNLNEAQRRPQTRHIVWLRFTLESQPRPSWSTSDAMTQKRVRKREPIPTPRPKAKQRGPKAKQRGHFDCPPYVNKVR